MSTRRYVEPVLPVLSHLNCELFRVAQFLVISDNCVQIMTYSLKPEVKGEADTCGPNKLCVTIMGPQYVHEKGTLGDMYIQKYILSIV